MTHRPENQKKAIAPRPRVMVAFPTNIRKVTTLLRTMLLMIFLVIREKDSLADVKKFVPYMAI